MSRDLSERQRKPHTAKPQHGAIKAWWYEDDTGISVYTSDGTKTHYCRITRRALLAWIERTKL